MERGVSYTQTTRVSQPSTLPSKKLNKKIEEALGELTHYYRSNSLSANPDKPQVRRFICGTERPRGRYKYHGMEWTWRTLIPKVLDKTLSYKTHIHNTKMKVATQNNLLKKLANSRCGTNARTIRTTALVLWYSTAEYAAPAWESKSGKNQTGRERDPLPIWTHTSNKPSKVYNHFTSQQKLSESTNGREDWRRRHMQA